MRIIDFSALPKSPRHGRYGGQAGDKDGVLYNRECWIVKYPKSTRGMTGDGLAPYTTSPLSEYIGSQIYDILGYDVHKTMLVFRNGQICVACKDFQKNMGDLAEIRTVKNSANHEIREATGEVMPMSATGDTVNLEELLLHFDVNPLMNRADLKERFWDCTVIDIFMDNNDRNNGNWGLLYNADTEGYDIAPIYDNGNSFNNKLTDEKIRTYLNTADSNLFIGTRTAYEYNGHILSAKKLLGLDMQELRDAIIRVTPKIMEGYDRIMSMIDDIPETYEQYAVCSKDRKEFYKQSLKARFNALIKPVYEKLCIKTEEYMIKDTEQNMER